MKKIRNTLLLFYLTPVLLLQLASGIFFYAVTKSSLDAELGLRLESVARNLSDRFKPVEIGAWQELPMDSPTLEDAMQELRRMKTLNDLAQVYVLNPAGELIVGTRPELLKGIRPPQLALHETEVDQAIRGISTSTLLFRGEDGQYYKTAFSPIGQGADLSGVMVVEASAAFFSSLERLAKGLTLFAGMCMLILFLISILISKKIVTPLEELSQMAQRMGHGELTAEVNVKSDNEIGLLSRAMDDMRRRVLARDRELNLMLQGIAHEVRNPLGGMELFAGLLKDEVPDDKSKSYVQRIQTEINNVKRLVEDFLNFTRGIMVHKKTMILKNILSEVRDYFVEDIKRQDLKMEVICDADLRVSVDPDQMKRALSNVVKNAIQASPRGASIVIKGEQQGLGFVVSIIDKGCGMSSEQIERVFEPFFTTKERGSGLGLAFVQKIVQAHQGHIEVISVPNQGTEFRIHV